MTGLHWFGMRAVASSKFMHFLLFHNEAHYKSDFFYKTCATTVVWQNSGVLTSCKTNNPFMRSPFFYVLLLVLVVLDGWLLAHPNLIGRAGVFFFEYDYLETFPKALSTVAAIVGLSLLIAWAVSRLSRTLALILLVVLVMASGYWLFNNFQVYNTGVYKLTGAGFRAGAILLPGLVMLVFGQKLFDRLQRKSTRP